jgi:hypothetical protein
MRNIGLTHHATTQPVIPTCVVASHGIRWDDFRHFINERLTLNVSLKTGEDIEAAVKFFDDTIQLAG